MLYTNWKRSELSFFCTKSHIYAPPNKKYQGHDKNNKPKPPLRLTIIYPSN